MVSKQMAILKRSSKNKTIIGKTAARLFNKKGYMETNMEEIAAAAGVSKGAVYYYFSSKNEILYYISSNVIDSMLEDLESELLKINDSYSKIQYLIFHHIEHYINNQTGAKTLLHEAHCLTTKYFKAIAVKERRYYQIVTDVLSEFFDGQISKSQITAVTFQLFGMCNWTYSWYDPKKSITPIELSKIICTIFMNGVNELKMSDSADKVGVFEMQSLCA